MSNLKDVVVIFDSGIGGLSYFEYIKSRLSKQNYVYIADNKNFPYGEKTSEFLLKEILKLILKLREICNISSIVFACNTASVITYGKLDFTFPVIYTLPSISLVEELVSKKVILIATDTTINSEFVQNEKRLHGDLMLRTAGELINFVEYGDRFKDHALRCLESLKIEVKASRRDVIFLGCTHYLHIKDMIENFLEIPIYENRAAVANELARTVKITDSDDAFTNYFYLTKDENLCFYKSFCEKYSLQFKGIID
ncbi:glutamate racemase [Borrelia turcica IST7]|uniref:Glutamate racemase n=1 Tax=Borrelia turcica IST7 TaxID=1104446 RepID=A0A386PMC4_9SPIR|nr:glutamate racemase [Borrelia turcica]AYE35997.1 glutamate racemase [Borrelia turcica IST7]